MGGGDRMSTTAFLAAMGCKGNSQISALPQGLLQALALLDQNVGEVSERGSLSGVVDSLVEWFLTESMAPRSADGASVWGFMHACCLSSYVS